MRHLFLAASAICLTVGMAHAQDQSGLDGQAPRSIIVMDGSGSMWGQIDGRTKLEIARETVAQVLQGIPAPQEIGLMAYGHRRKGDCGDIELMVAPAAGTGPDIAARVNTMKFLGKTPLSDAVRKAAEALRYGEEAATVILVTDGLETCAADPCALGRELEAGGLDFTAHVIGFGLTQQEGAQVACLAQETGGRYFEARDAASLAEALTQTMTDAPETAPTALPTTALTAPESAPMGSKIQVGWTGVPKALDTIEIGLVGESYFDYTYVADGNPVTLQMPGAVGPYELRYKTSDNTVIAARMIESLEAPLSISAPDQAIAGQLVPVAWTGPDAEYDNMQLRAAGDDSYITYEYVRGQNPLVLRMPDAAGAYELTYKLNDSEVIFARPIAVVPVGSQVPPIPAALLAPEQAEAGTELQIRWQGPGFSSDEVVLRAQGAPDVLASVAIGKGDIVRLTMPSEAGEYELAYVFANEAELATLPITVFAAEAEQAAPAPIAVTIEADTADLGVQWSATPAPENARAPGDTLDAWAMNESLFGPVETAFLPGIYDVRGDAGDTVFTGRIEVIEGGETRFVIGYDAAQSPAGPDEPNANPGPQDPVSVTISGEYAAMLTQWQATPLSGQASDVLGTGAFSSRAWETTLDPGDWLIEGWSEGGKGPLYVARISVAPQQPQTITLKRTTAPDQTVSVAQDGGEIVQRCLGDTACYGVSAAGLRLVLLPGWATGAAYAYETAGGVVAAQKTIEIYAGDPLAIVAVLNPRQWDAMLGPCEAIDLGDLCRLEQADVAGIVALRGSLAAIEPAATPEEAGGDAAFEALEGQAIALPEGVDLREFLAPGLVKE